MEYVKGEPFFCKVQKQIKQYPYVDKNLITDILIVGGGVDGAVLNYYLSQKYKTILVDKSRLGHSCTSCATVLLEYQLDDFANELTKEMSEDEIVACYKMGQYCIQKIEKFVCENGNYCEFALRPSFLYTDRFFGKTAITDEHKFRLKHGFKSELYTSKNNPFPFKIKAGIFCTDGGCEVNPYLFTKQMIENSKNQKGIFENTKIDSYEKTADGYVAHTNFGFRIKCKKIVIATGFNWELMNKTDLCERFVSYTIVTKPIKNFSWKDNALVQDDANPYHYIRILPDNRIIVGGDDTPFNNKIIDEKLAYKKYDDLLKFTKKLLPDISDMIEIDSKFCGCFGQTENNLGLIGKTQDENILYFLSCGANGIINAMYGAELIDDIFNNRPNPLEDLFSPIRNI